MPDASPEMLSIFSAALERAGGAERETYLQAACGENAELRARLAALLRAHDEAGGFLAEDSARAAVQETIVPTESKLPGEMIGPYKLIERIGEGGMGTVWMAQQTEPVKRVVALKLIKAGMDSRQVIARFEAERQALALMDHANIAKVLDAGATSAGRPYFVMDLVKGVPITRYCDEHHFTPRQRLELFVPVCQAVQHAHQKGIIHRDLKPSNVLVALYDGKPVPKVIDFGVAKAAGQPLTDKTLVTGFGNIVGTLEYMSPEQAEINQLDIDTRSDIYSLGVLLYELLAGSPPFTRKELEKAGMLEMLRVIREQEPSRPSTKLSTAEGLPTLAANRGTEPAKLTKLVRGELDWIVMKALEKDRNRRYETANGFAADVQRYLADEPVAACPPSMGYRLRKYVRRHKGGLAVAGLVLFFLVLLGSGAGWAVRERAARQAEAERERHQRHLRATTQVESILMPVDKLQREQKWDEALAAVRQAQAVLATGEADAKLMQRVRQLLADLELVNDLEELRQLQSDATTDGFDLKTLGRRHAQAFRQYGVDVEALPVGESAARLGSRPALAVALAQALDNWADVEGTSKNQEGGKRLLALATAIDPDPWRAKVRQAVAATDFDALARLAESEDVARQPPATQVLLAKSINRSQPEVARELLVRAGEASPGDYWVHFHLALNASNAGEFEMAQRHFLVTRALRPRSAMTWTNLGSILFVQEKLDEAIACYRKALELKPNYAWAHMNLGNVLISQKRFEEAVASCRKAVELEPNIAEWHRTLGDGLGKLKQSDEAIACYRKAIELNPKIADVYNNLGYILNDRNQLDEASASYRKAIELEPKRASFHSGLGLSLRRQKKFDESIASYRQAIELDPKFAEAHNGLGAVLMEYGKVDEAAVSFSNAIELKPTLALAHAALGDARREQGKLDEAVASYRKAIELDPKDVKVHNNLGLALQAQNQLDQAIECFRTAVGLAPKLPLCHLNLGDALKDRGKFEEAIACYRKAIELDPKDFMVHNNLGLAFLAQKKLDQAIDCFRTAIGLAPMAPLCHLNLGVALKDCGNFEEAIACYRKAIEVDPKYADAYLNLGAVYHSQKKLDEAIASYHKAIDINPKFAFAHHNLGRALHEQKKPEEASASYRQAIELDPRDAQAHNALGVILSEQGKLDEAIASYRKAIELDPKHAVAHCNLGNSLRQKGRPEEAIDCFRRSIELDPKDGVAQLNLGNLLLYQKDLEGAAEAYREAMRLKPDFALAHANLGEALRRQNKLDEAVVSFRKALELEPRQANVHFNFGLALQSQKNMDQAIASYKKAAELEPKRAGILNHLAWLLATTPDPKLRDPAEAVRLAEACIRLTPQIGGNWNTVGVARYRARDWKGAIEALGRSIELREGGDAADWFFLAMAHWQLGNQEEARMWHAKAVAWMENRTPDDEELRRFRVEAEELIRD